MSSRVFANLQRMLDFGGSVILFGTMDSISEALESISLVIILHRKRNVYESDVSALSL